jgi:D-alanyl-D-alanine carboxypeptidase (penicillin-binding protein 5/6)
MFRLTRALSATTTALIFFVSQGFLAEAQAQVPEPPEVAARSYLVLDVTANQILAAKDIDLAVEPASLTKLMSAYLVFDALKSKKIALKQTLENAGFSHVH